MFNIYSFDLGMIFISAPYLFKMCTIAFVTNAISSVAFFVALPSFALEIINSPC